ncbi:MAG: hypothetical protein LN561_03285 [Rickettsia endosymbiont of Labidopullus appendiculatus]|nr:hypothetical protein [Rickettsia endosymbiont of Labidopullus appendiculatus]
MIVKNNNGVLITDLIVMGSKEPSSTVLTSEEEAMCIAFRKHLSFQFSKALL